MMTVAESLKRLRSKNRLTQVELSRLSGVSQSQISTIESGEDQPGIETLSRLASALNISVAVLDERLLSAPPGAYPAEEHANFAPAYTLGGELLGMYPVVGTPDFCLVTEADTHLSPELPDSALGLFELTTEEPKRGDVVASGPAPFLVGRYGVSIVEMPKRKLYRLVGFFHTGGADPKRFLLPVVTK